MYQMHGIRICLKQYTMSASQKKEYGRKIKEGFKAGGFDGHKYK